MCNEEFEARQIELLNSYYKIKDNNNESIKELKKEIEEKIIEHNIGLIKMVVINNQSKVIEYDDLFQEAKLAMLEALRRYDFNSDAKFSTYAFIRMDGKLKKYITENARTIKVHELAQENCKVFKKVYDELCSELRRKPLNKEIQNRLNEKEETLYKSYTCKDKNKIKWNERIIERMKIIDDQSYMRSINEKIDDNDENEFYEILEDTSIERPDIMVFNRSELEYEKKRLNELLNYYNELGINDMVIDVLKLRYGLYDNYKKIIIDTINIVGREKFGPIKPEGLTLNQISLIYNIVKESVRIYESMGIRQLKMLIGEEPTVEIKEGHDFRFLPKDLRLDGRKRKNKKTEIEFLDYDKDILFVDKKTRFVKGLKQGKSKLTLYDKNNDRVVTYNFEVTPKYLSLKNKKKN